MILSALPEGKELTLNGQALPGIVRSVSVNGKMQAERNARADGGRDFELKGWEPAEISVEVALLQGGETSQDDLLQSMVALFQKTEDGEAVQYELSFPQTRAWGIGRCYFTGLDSKQGSVQMYNVSLKFVEFRPEIDQIKTTAKAKSRRPECSSRACTAATKYE